MPTTITTTTTRTLTTLEILTGYNRGQRIPVLGRHFLIGSSDRCQLKLTHPDISPLHCGLLCDGYTVRLRDLGSTHGTEINGNRVMRDTPLQNGDIITVSRTLIRIHRNQI